jgi:hypothetical protein
MLAVDELIDRVRRDTTAFEQAVLAADDPRTAETARLGATIGITVAREVLHVALTGELPEDEDIDEASDLASLVARYSQAIESCIAHVEAAEPDAFLDVTWRHPDLGDLNWRQWFLFLAQDARLRTLALAQGTGDATQ